jgi:eukaryotic-like serine/threonine-protein kinase
VALAPGALLGTYEIVAPLGSGGMGEVYRARDTKLHRDVALKILPDGFGSDPERISRFQREARTLAALNHPHIAAIYGLEDTAGTPVLVMELVEGEDLARRLARGAIPIPVADALAIAIQIADALDAAHERGIVHRDLKPANIKLRVDGTVKVLDFGLAKMFDDERGGQSPADGATISSPVTMTSAGMVLGTAAYMSPEQARGQTVDARTDLWAFGCVLFEMLTGTRAFPGDTVTDILAAVVKEEPRWHDLPAATPAAMRRLLRRCLTKDRKRRLASVADARLDIEEALDPGRADATPTAARTSRPSPWTMAIGLGIVFAAVASAYFLGSRAATVRSTPAPVTRFVIPAPPGTQIISGHREVALSPDGQQVAFIARGTADQHIYVRRLDDPAPRQIAGTEAARDLTFSPDGRWLAFHAGNKIRKVRLAGGAPTVLADAPHAHGLAWHPSEDAIYFAPHQSSAIWKVAASGETPAVAVTTLDSARSESSHAWPMISDDGHTLVFTANTNTVDEPTASFLTLAANTRQTFRTGGGAFALTDGAELLFVRRRSVMSAQYRENRLSSPEFLETAAAIREANNGTGVIALSSSGTLAYVPSSDIKQRTLVWISPDGTVSDAGFGQREFGAVSLSPDGRRAAITVGDGPDAALYLADVGGGPLTMLAKPATWMAAWSPDGKWIAGGVLLPDQAFSAPARIAAERGGTWKPLLAGDANDNLVAQWAPDGRALLVSHRDSQTGRRSVAMLAIDGTPAKASVIVDSAENYLVQLPSLSPDGRWLAYESNETGRAEVYVQNYPSSAARVQVSRDGGSRPMWAKRADALYFIAGSGIMSSTVTTHPDLRAGVPRLIVNEPLLYQGGAANKAFDVAPDGRILAIKEDGSVRSDHLVVVQNWMNEVRARHVDDRK